MHADEYEDACQTIPGYTEAARAVGHINDRLKQLRQSLLTIDPSRMSLGQARKQITDQLIELAAQQPLPDDLAGHNWGPAWRDSMQIAENENLRTVLTEAAGKAEDRRRMHVERNSAPALAYLNKRLVKILVKARNTSLLDEATAEYAAIRQAQKTITITVTNPGPPALCHGNISGTLADLAVAGEMADQFEQWPRWTRNGKPGSPQYDERPPWPTSLDMNRIEYTPEYVQWAARTSAHLWVPTIPQMRAAITRFNRLNEARTQHAQDVRNGYVPRERWTIPDELSLDTLLDQLNAKETANV